MFTFQSFWSVRTKSPAPVIRTTESATCATTRIRSSVRERRPGVVRPFLHDRTGIDTRAAQRGRQAEENPCEQRHGGGEGEDRQVRMRRPAACGESPVEIMRTSSQAAPPRQRHGQSATDQRQHHAFGENLPDEPAAAGSQRHSDGDLAAPAGSAGEQQVGYVCARDQQHDSRHPHQQLQGKRVAVPQAAIHAGCGRPERQVAIANEMAHIFDAAEFRSRQLLRQNLPAESRRARPARARAKLPGRGVPRSVSQLEKGSVHRLLSGARRSSA